MPNDMSPDTKISRRDFLKVAGITAAGALLSTCVPPSSEKPTAVPTTIPPTEAPKTPEPVVDLTAEAAKKTTLNSNLTNLIPENGVFTQGIGGEISGVFGDPKITGPLSSLQIDAARAMLGRINPGTLYAVPNGKAVIQRLTGVKDGIDYSNKPDAEVPFKVTVTMLPNTFLQKDGEYVILPEETKPGEARYIRTNDQTKWNVTTSFLVEPGFLPTGAALWWDAASMGMQPVIWDGDGNPRLMGNLQVDVTPVVIAPTPEPTKVEQSPVRPDFVQKGYSQELIDRIRDGEFATVESAYVKLAKDYGLTDAEFSYFENQYSKMVQVALEVKTDPDFIYLPPLRSIDANDSVAVANINHVDDFFPFPDTKAGELFKIAKVPMEGTKLDYIADSWVRLNDKNEIVGVIDLVPGSVDYGKWREVKRFEKFSLDMNNPVEMDGNEMVKMIENGDMALLIKEAYEKGDIKGPGADSEWVQGEPRLVNTQGDEWLYSNDPFYRTKDTRPMVLGSIFHGNYGNNETIVLGLLYLNDFSGVPFPENIRDVRVLLRVSTASWARQIEKLVEQTFIPLIKTDKDFTKYFTPYANQFYQGHKDLFVQMAQSWLNRKLISRQYQYVPTEMGSMDFSY